jgi:hypothetical protein
MSAGFILPSMTERKRMLGARPRIALAVMKHSEVFQVGPGLSINDWERSRDMKNGLRSCGLMNSGNSSKPHHKDKR